MEISSTSTQSPYSAEATAQRSRERAEAFAKQSAEVAEVRKARAEALTAEARAERKAEFDKQFAPKNRIDTYA